MVNSDKTEHANRWGGEWVRMTGAIRKSRFFTETFTCLLVALHRQSSKSFSPLGLPKEVAASFQSKSRTPQKKRCHKMITPQIKC